MRKTKHGKGNEQMKNTQTYPPKHYTREVTHEKIQRGSSSSSNGRRVIKWNEKGNRKVK